MMERTLMVSVSPGTPGMTLVGGSRTPGPANETRIPRFARTVHGGEVELTVGLPAC